jgi:hypothetical protein
VSGTLQAATDLWRERLVALGYSDDGVRLRGPVPWTHRVSGAATARVEIVPRPTFPFAPPAVFILDPGAPLEPTFHIERNGCLCLWDDDWPLDEAPWRDPRTLVNRIAGWLENTAAGWPNDDVCDLERYLDPEPGILVLYDVSTLTADACVRTSADSRWGTITITDERRRIGDFRDARRRRRKDNRLAWIADIGAVQRPLRSWSDVAVALGTRADEVDRLISLGAVNLLLLRYTRGARSGAVAIRVRRTPAGIQVTACESADTSAATRNMRAGPAAAELADARIAIVGCGAIGSFAADLLFRSGARQLTLIDGERLRPGNVVRHLAGTEHVGRPKTHAVRDCLTAVDSDVSGVRTHFERLSTLEEATELVRDHQVVLDATGNARATSLLATAAETVGRSTAHTVVSVCVQRDGDVLRVDRMPLRRGETHLPPLPRRDDTTHLLERGCGSPVSPTPPGAVIAAAELAHRVVIDEATHACELPATIAEVRRAQPEHAYQKVGTVASDETACEAAA